MKRKIYVEAHEADALKDATEESQITSREHAFLTERKYSDNFKSKDALIRWYLSENERKLPALEFFTEHVKANRLTNILSLGAGACVLEYLLKSAIPAEFKVVATDFDSYFIEKAKLLLPDIIPVEFDFSKGNIAHLQTSLQVCFDIAVFFGSSYVMDDPQFVNLFKNLKGAGIKQIVDFQAGYMDLREVISSAMSPVKRSSALRRLFGKPRYV